MYINFIYIYIYIICELELIYSVKFQVYSKVIQLYICIHTHTRMYIYIDAHTHIVLFYILFLYRG